MTMEVHIDVWMEPWSRHPQCPLAMLAGSSGQDVPWVTKVKSLKFGVDSFFESQLEGVSAWNLHLKAEAQLCVWWVLPLTAMDGRANPS